MEIIDLKNIQWNKMTPEEYSALEQKLFLQQKELKKLNRKKVEKKPNKVISLNGLKYWIDGNTYKRLITIRSPKSREKLIKFIEENYKPIEDL